jgi:hypothetical protein
MSPRVSVERNAVAPIGKPMALSHSPRRTSIGTSTRARLILTLPAKTGGVGSVRLASRGALARGRGAREAVDREYAPHLRFLAGGRT